MKFIHIADVHLGAVPDSGMPWGKTREKEIWESFHNIIDVCNEQKADLLLIAGDLFHRQPLIRELKEVNYYFSKLETAHVVLMAGNHDYIGARSSYTGFSWDERVHMFCQDTLEAIVFPEMNTEIYGFSYQKRDITEPLYDSARPMKNNLLHILLAHGGDDKDIPINRRKLIDSGFDYVALGHIHKPEIIDKRMAYSGSLEPIDKNETGERGYILGEINRDELGNTVTSICFVNQSIRQYITLNLDVDPYTTNGSLLDQTKERMERCGIKNIYELVLQGIRDESVHFDKEALKNLGNVIEVVDKTVPDYDFDALYRENADNLIGMFIKKIRDEKAQDEVARKALYYGMEALLK